MDLSTIEGLTEEQKIAILGLHESDVAGLKENRDTILSEKKTLESLQADKDIALEEARRIAIEKEEARLKAEGDVEGLKAHYEEQLAEKTALANQQAQAAQNALTERDKQAVKAKVLSKVDDRFTPFAETMLDNMLSVNYAEGKPQYSFTDSGNEIAKDIDSFIGWAETNDSWKSVLKAVDSTGSGAQGATTGGAGNNSAFTEMTTEQKVAYLEKNPPIRR